MLHAFILSFTTLDYVYVHALSLFKERPLLRSSFTFDTSLYYTILVRII